jgi:hypothetical protein
MDDDGLRAYSLGYMTHLATDTTAHSFVNSICGSPFRTHWQRHHLVENHIDTLWYLQDDLGPRARLVTARRAPRSPSRRRRRPSARRGGRPAPSLVGGLARKADACGDIAEGATA